MQIAIVGSGYVGLVTGACFADFGHDVVCVDKAEDKISALKAGCIPIFEPGLDEIIARNTSAGRLSFTTDLRQPISSLTVQVYTYATGPYEDWHRQAWAGALVLVSIVLICSLLARLATRRLERMHARG